MENLFHIFPSNNFIDLGMYQMGSEKCAPGHSFGPASRNHFLFHYVLAGNGVLHAPNASGELCHYPVGQDEGFLLMPGHVTTYIADSRTPWEYMWIEFDGLRVQETLEIAGFSLDNLVYRSKKPALRDAMRSQMIYIIQHENASMLELIGHMYLFLDLMTRSLSGKPIPAKSRLRNFYIQEAISFIEEHYQSDISVEVGGRNCEQLRLEPQLLRQNIQRSDRQHAAEIFAELPHGQGNRAAAQHGYADCRNLAACRLSEPAALFTGFQRTLRRLTAAVAE